MTPKKNKFLLITGTHGDEPSSLEIVKKINGYILKNTTEGFFANWNSYFFLNLTNRLL